MLMRSGQPSSMNPVYGETVEGGREEGGKVNLVWKPQSMKSKVTKFTHRSIATYTAKLCRIPAS